MWKYIRTRGSNCGLIPYKLYIILTFYGDVEAWFTGCYYLSCGSFDFRNLQGLIETVSHLLQIQLILTEETGNQYECPYNIRSVLSYLPSLVMPDMFQSLYM